MKYLEPVTSLHRGVKYQIDGDCDFVISCNGKCVSNAVAACNPDPDSQGEIHYPTFGQTEKAIRSSISCWLEMPLGNCMMRRGEIHAAQDALDSKRTLLLDLNIGDQMVQIKEIEHLMLKFDGLLNKKH